MASNRSADSKGKNRRVELVENMDEFKPYKDGKMTKYFISLICLVILLPGCSNNMGEKAVENAIEKETGANADVDLSDKGMNIRGETEDGEFSISSGENAKVPDNFPSDILIYKPSKVSTSMNTPQGQSLTLATTDNAQKVLETYKKEMTSKGWAEQTSMTSGSMSMLVYGKEDRTVHVHITPSDDQTAIMLIASDE